MCDWFLLDSYLQTLSGTATNFLGKEEVRSCCISSKRAARFFFSHIPCAARGSGCIAEKKRACFENRGYAERARLWAIIRERLGERQLRKRGEKILVLSLTWSFETAGESPALPFFESITRDSFHFSRWAFFWPSFTQDFLWDLWVLWPERKREKDKKKETESTEKRVRKKVIDQDLRFIKKDLGSWNIHPSRGWYPFLTKGGFSLIGVRKE